MLRELSLNSYPLGVTSIVTMLLRLQCPQRKKGKGNKQQDFVGIAIASSVNKSIARIDTTFTMVLFLFMKIVSSVGWYVDN